MIHFLQPTHLFPKAEVEKVCPWYYQMKAIIGECPNVKPVGIGNSASELNLDVLVTSTQDGGTSLKDAKPAVLSENDDDDDDDDDDNNGDHNDDNETLGEDLHCTCNKCSVLIAGLDEDVKPKLVTPARLNVSKPTATGSKSKKLKGLEELAEITAAEEVTRQKELDLQIQKLKSKASKVQAKAEVKKAAIEAKKEKEKQTHEMEMIKLWLEFARVHQATPGIGPSIPTQLGQSSIHPSGPYPPFSSGFDFGGGSQFDGMTSGNEGMEQERFGV